MSKKLNANEISHLIAITEFRIDEIEKENKETYREIIADEKLRDDIISTNNAVIAILKSAVKKLSSM